MGAAGPVPTSYRLQPKGPTEARPANSGFSALALWQILPDDDKPTEIWFLLTEAAERNAWAAIQAESKKLGVVAHAISLGNDENIDNASHFLEQTAKNIPEGCTLTLDITQGLRHHAFLFFALALYLSKFRDNQVAGVWYCRMETEKGCPKPIIDLKPVLNLVDWFLALYVFQATGSTAAIAGLVTGKAQEYFRNFSQEFLTGVPVEAGLSARRLLTELSSEGYRLGELPLEENLRRLLQKEIEPFVGDFKEKSECKLDQAELARQARFIARYLETGQQNLAFGFMREWLVNRMLASQSPENWLQLKAREAVERQLGCLTSLLSNKKDPNRKALSEELKALAKDWDDLIKARNALQHNAMRPDSLPTQAIERLQKTWHNKPGWDTYPTVGGGQGTLLICPLGNASGVLFSALSHKKPKRCLVICSERSKEAIDEAVARAGWGGSMMQLVMNDPHSGFDEFGELVQQAKSWLFEADSIEVNLTGGTSLMGVLAGQLADQSSRSYRRPTNRFVLLDTRTPEEQRSAPWVLGKVRDLVDTSKQTGE